MSVVAQCTANDFNRRTATSYRQSNWATIERRPITFLEGLGSSVDESSGWIPSIINLES
jgi:hypothetical protein